MEWVREQMCWLFGHRWVVLMGEELYAKCRRCGHCELIQTPDAEGG